MDVPYYIVIEEQEYNEYASVINPKKILVLDKKYKDTYITYDMHGLTKSTGPGPARNFAWDHAISNRSTWHWVMDDNIRHFYRLVLNRKLLISSPVAFTIMEDFCLRYSNIAMAGPNYAMFAKRKQKIPPYITNTRIYSCNFIRNDVPFRWQGRYNEDTDLSLRMLKAGWCTVQFNAILQDKVATQTLRGGNTDAFYAREGTLAKSQMQVAMHPDVSRLVWKFGRWHHHVDYRPFRKNKLILRDDIQIERGVNNYGMVLRKVEKQNIHNGMGCASPRLSIAETHALRPEHDAE